MSAKTLLLTTGLIVTSSLSLSAALAGPVSAVDKSFEGATALRLSEFVGTVELKKGDSFTVSLSNAEEGGPLDVGRSGGAVVIEGERGTVKKLYRRGSPWQRGWRGNGDDAVVKFGEFLGDYPMLTVTLPEGSDLEISDAALILDGEMTFGKVSVDNLREVYGTLGDADEADIGIGGMGEIAIGDIAGTLDIGIGGSGDVYTGDAAQASVRIGGSGDVSLGDIKGPLDIKIGGSGDVEAGDLGALSVSVGGSGDIEADEVAGDVKVSINGSGDVRAASLKGAFEVSINGSGDVDIERGQSTATEIRINGSGDVSFGGTAKNPSVAVYGSGDVDIDDYTGNVHVKGDTDDIRIGDLTFEKNR